MKKLSPSLYCFILLLFVSCSALKAQLIKQLEQGKPTSTRGLSVVDDSIAWLSGSKGYIAVTHNGGKVWAWQQVKGFEKADFRDIEAFSDKEAIIMSSGTPALILKTTDGGATWKVNYNNADTTYFLDAMDFDFPSHGLVLGDPIRNKFLLLETNDGGETWHPFKNQPDALPGEAAFAASGTCLRVINGKLLIASGGNSTRLLTYTANSNLWSYTNLPIIHGKASQGAFSLAVGEKEGILVGGDYMHDKKIDSVVCYHTLPFVNNFNLSTAGPAGFQSCIEFICNSSFISTGTSGTNITTDGGKNWLKIDEISYNVCRRARHGKLVLLAGNGGKTGILKQ